MAVTQCTISKVCVQAVPAGRRGISKPDEVANTSLPPAYSASSFSATCMVRLEKCVSRHAQSQFWKEETELAACATRQFRAPMTYRLPCETELCRASPCASRSIPCKPPEGWGSDSLSFPHPRRLSEFLSSPADPPAEAHTPLRTTLASGLLSPNLRQSGSESSKNNFCLSLFVCRSRRSSS